ncbi:MAG: DUF296 domain-containing protein [Candidatus Kaiserbacteria bacterium]|nr:DUF296 domain-containing protein [Candidatus Kaiserbacteria bacterium]MCB9816847.1 DUF296 domain-containing protein [Candidatus Nomurabacteria bacterium]
MQIVHQQDNVYTLSFSRGEEVMSVIADHCKKHNITAAHLTGLGAADQLDIAYYNLATKEYERHTIDEEVEVLSLIGNIGAKDDGQIIMHIHGTFGRKDLSVFGGHLFSMQISGAGEIHFTVFDGTINRSFDEATGLNLMCHVPE